ncbi:MAG TPA: tRNA pseudouridine(38-40) synthase TruA [Acidimicrobiales bacterium]|nr:tRNA pseudouridine(38-40) synthase TruA [Acidimicrobiales bacterium]
MTLFDLGAAEPDPPDDGRPHHPLLEAPRDISHEERAAPSGPLVRVALGVAYDGSGFHGFAAQPDQRTVAGALGEALEAITGAPVAWTCAGRTDSGVHATAQVVHVDLAAGLLARRYGASGAPGEELAALASSLSHQAGPDVEVWRALTVPADFDARRSALSRRYRYDVEVGRRNPLRRHQVWHVGEPVDLAVLRLATDPLVGEHDFAAFCRRPPDRPSGPLTRRVLDARWKDAGEGVLRFEIEAKAFCHQMVRSAVGALVAAGTGRIRPSDVVALLRSGERTGAPQLAPPEGLCLVAVRYADELGGSWS